jgi:D-alanyl-D-alanine carboxypeptidase/D-alanyl-D-alanine-endopeptidase (penicillin-binding protein 4)
VFTLIPTEAMFEVFAAMMNTAEGEMYESCLPVAGVDGTLKNRFVNTPAQYIVHAKTGTISGKKVVVGW